MVIKPDLLRCSLEDICYPDDLQDHHNRDNEQLVTVRCWYLMSFDDLLEGALSDLAGFDNEVTQIFSQKNISLAIEEELVKYFKRDEIIWSNGEDDEVYCYLVLSW